MSSASLTTNREIFYLPVDRITPNPYQPRRYFDKESIEELSLSIKEYGVIQPITVRLINGTSYELVSGERRLRATKLAGLMTIPALIVNTSDQDSAILAIIENLQRQDLNYIEEAEGFFNLLNDYFFTQEQLAEKIGKSQSTIANKLRILKLPRKIQRFLIENNLSERHARAILKLEDEEQQLEVLKKVVEFDLTVQKTEDLVKKITEVQEAQKEQPQKKTKNIRRFMRDIRIFTNSIKETVDILNSSGFKTDYLMEEVEDGYEILIKIENQSLETDAERNESQQPAV